MSVIGLERYARSIGIDDAEIEKRGAYFVLVSGYDVPHLPRLLGASAGYAKQSLKKIAEQRFAAIKSRISKGIGS